MTSMWKNYSKKHSMIKFYSKLTNTDNLHSKGDKSNIQTLLCQIPGASEAIPTSQQHSIVGS